MSKRVALILNQKELILLNKLQRTGLYGHSIATTVRRLLDQKIYETLIDRRKK